MILTVTLNPAIDHALYVDTIRVGDANRVLRAERDAGGKGINLSRIVTELGGTTLATGFLAGEAGSYIRSVLKKEGVPVEFLEVPGETRINFSVEQSSKEPPTTFNEPGPTIPSESFEQLCLRCREWAPKSAWACLGGSLPKGLPQDAYRVLGEIFIQGGARLCLDADGDALKHGLECRPHFIKPNLNEAARLLGRELGDSESVVTAARELLDHVREFVVVSCGEEGAILAAHTGEIFLGKSPQVEANSTIGSGDSMIGGLLWALEEGKKMQEAFRWGLAAGAATAMTDGSSIADRPTIERLFATASVEAV